jgi:hypothetical protein
MTDPLIDKLDQLRHAINEHGEDMGTLAYIELSDRADTLRTGITELQAALAELAGERDEAQARSGCHLFRAEAAEARVAECEKEVASLRAFANEVMEDWPEGAPDGGALQDYATKHGLLREVTMAGPCGDACGCSEFLSADEWPNECYRHTSLLTGKPETDAAIDALAGQGEL